ncbi:MAG: hypothetical protein CW338_07890 [Clostridiales bacterium]|nr:hypothetical protein [Clostridiales bacterium]
MRSSLPPAQQKNVQQGGRIARSSVFAQFVTAENKRHKAAHGSGKVMIPFAFFTQRTGNQMLDNIFYFAYNHIQTQGLNGPAF